MMEPVFVFLALCIGILTLAAAIVLLSISWEIIRDSFDDFEFLMWRKWRRGK